MSDNEHIESANNALEHLRNQRRDIIKQIAAGRFTMDSVQGLNDTQAAIESLQTAIADEEEAAPVSA
jgi:glutamate synthase domain-containing protein 2